MDLSKQITENIDKSMDLIDKFRRNNTSNDLSIEENQFLECFYQSFVKLNDENNYYSYSSGRKFDLIEFDLQEFVSLINKFNIDINSTILTSNPTRYAKLSKILAELSSQFSIIISNFDKEYDDFDKNFIRFFVNYSNHCDNEINNDEKQMVDTDVSYMFKLIENNQDAIKLLKKCIRDRPRFKPVIDKMSEQLKSLNLSNDINESIMNVIVQSKAIKNFDSNSMLLALRNLRVDISNKDVIDFIKTAVFELKKFELGYKLHFNNTKINIFNLLVGLNDKKHSTPEKLAELKSQILTQRINNKELINNHAGMLTSTRDTSLTFKDRLKDALKTTIDMMHPSFDSLYISDDLIDLYLQIQDRYHYEKEFTIEVDRIIN